MSPEEDNKMAHATDSPASREDSEVGQHDRPVIVEGDDQRGIQNVEAVTLSWTKTALIVVFLKYVVTIPKPTGEAAICGVNTMRTIVSG